MDACLKLSSAVHLHPSDSSHSESTSVLRRVAESSTLHRQTARASSQPETQLHKDQRCWDAPPRGVHRSLYSVQRL